MGGVDTIVFVGEKVKKFKGLIFDICERLRFLGLKYKKNPHSIGKLLDITARKSSIKVFCLEYDKAEILRNEIVDFLNRMGG